METTGNQNTKWEKKIKIKRSGYFTALILSVTLIALLGLFGTAIEILTNFNIEQRILFWAILALFFAIFMPLLIPTRRVEIIKLIGRQDIVHETIKEVEKPVARIVEVEVEKPVVKYRNKIVEKPVIKYREKKRKKLNIPKYDFLGSNDTMTYHKHGCRFSKLIKPKHKLSNNNEEFFKKAGFTKCKVCMPEEKVTVKKAAKKRK
jgi:hypothetical protein